MKNINSVDELIKQGLVSSSDSSALKELETQFSTLLPKTLLKLITSPEDPIAKQIIPSVDELHIKEHELSDPISDAAFSPLKGIVHRYPDRALFKPISSCPLYCRFCFRREQVGKNGSNGSLSDTEISNAINWIKEHQEVREIILSGGDPLILSFSKLKPILEKLSGIEHLDNIRIHTRVPIASPDLISPELLSLLKQLPKTVSIVIHTNHVQELGDKATEAIKKLSHSGVSLLSQSVLLKDVNDTKDALEKLFRALVRIGVKPYYLHHLDPAKGTSHFHVPVEKGLEILRALRGKMSGICWPLYVVDLPGGKGKVPLGPNYYLGNSLEKEQLIEKALSSQGEEITFF